MRRRSRTDELPRWVTRPLLVDWLTPEEMRDELRPYMALYLYFYALEQWCQPRGMVWQDVEAGYPKPLANGEVVDDDGPPLELVLEARDRTGSQASQ